MIGDPSVVIWLLLVAVVEGAVSVGAAAAAETGTTSRGMGETPPRISTGIGGILFICLVGRGRVCKIGEKDWKETKTKQRKGRERKG